jgi:hypothetical protein
VSYALQDPNDLCGCDRDGCAFCQRHRADKAEAEVARLRAALELIGVIIADRMEPHPRASVAEAVANALRSTSASPSKG